MTATAAVAASVGRSATTLFEALRPRQWLKNLLVFAALIFAGRLSEARRWPDALIVFASFCLISSGSYLVNDVRDAAADRLHPLKRSRPVARGSLSPEVALTAAVVLVSTGVSVTSLLGRDSLGYALMFAALQIAYTLVLKRAPFLDILVISSLFAIRAAAGADAVDVHISPWLVLCTALLALFLALAKRRGELVLAASGATPGRPALGGYSLELADRLLFATAAATVGTYALYAVAYSPHARWMVVTTPFVAYGVGRYLGLVRREDLGEEPESLLLSDRRLLTAIAVWALVAIVVVAAR